MLDLKKNFFSLIYVKIFFFFFAFFYHLIKKNFCFPLSNRGGGFPKLSFIVIRDLALVLLLFVIK